MTETEIITCGICGRKAPPATPLWNKMCRDCYALFRAATSDKVTTSGHPANQTYYYESDVEAKEKWFAHLRKCGFVLKRGRWVKEK